VSPTAGSSAEKIGAAAAAILTRNHGHRYYGWRLEKGVFQFFEHPVHFARERAYEGKYIISSNPKRKPVTARSGALQGALGG
jgi:hypothetical protein